MLAFLCTFAAGLLPRMTFSGAATSAPMAVAAQPTTAPASGMPPAPTAAQFDRNAATTSSPGALLQAIPLATPLPTAAGLNPTSPQVISPSDTNTLEQPTIVAAPTEPAGIPTQAALVSKSNQPPAPRAVARRISIPWIYVWLALAALLGGTALLIRWLAMQAFRRKYERNNKS
jgi:hypothetical protein